MIRLIYRFRIFDQNKTIIFEQNKIGLIVIDYLQLVIQSRTENRVQELSQITRSLKTIAREFDIPIIALSQLSRNVRAAWTNLIRLKRKWFH
jgi:replicative DNA helicase